MGVSRCWTPRASRCAGHPHGPGVVSPNELEAEGLVGREFSDSDDRRGGVEEIAELGAREAIMTGRRRMATSARARPALYRVTIEHGGARVSVGAGDAFLAGFVSSRYSGRANECLRFAVACGAESMQHFGAGQVEQREVGRLLPRSRGAPWRRR